LCTRVHPPSLAELEDRELAVVCDVDSEGLQEAIKEFEKGAL